MSYLTLQKMWVSDKYLNGGISMPETEDNYAQFGKTLIDLLDERGWNSMCKKRIGP